MVIGVNVVKLFGQTLTPYDLNFQSRVKFTPEMFYEEAGEPNSLRTCDLSFSSFVVSHLLKCC